MGIITLGQGSCATADCKLQAVSGAHCHYHALLNLRGNNERSVGSEAEAIRRVLKTRAQILRGPVRNAVVPEEMSVVSTNPARKVRSPVA